MKRKLFTLCSAVCMLVSLIGLSSCSNSNDGNGGGVRSNNPLSNNSYTIGSYNMSFYSDNTYEAVDNSNTTTPVYYHGTYSCDGTNLSITNVEAGSKAFVLEVGKTYTFKVEVSDKNIILKDPESGTTIATLSYAGTTSEKSEDVEKAETAALTPDAEKEYLKSLGTELEQYAVASEWSNYTDLGKEMDKVNSGDLGDYGNSLTKEELTSSYINSSWSEYYYDRTIELSNLSGSFECSYSSPTWKRTSSTGNFTLTYTDSHNAKWVLTASHSTTTLGTFYIDHESSYSYSYNSSVSKRYSNYIVVPTEATLTVTRSGVKMVEASVKISSYSNVNTSDKNVSLLGQCTGTATYYAKPSGEAINGTTSFSYTNKGNSYVHSNVKKGDVNLVTVDATCTPSASSSSEMSNITGIDVTATILNKLTMHVKASDGKSLSDAYNSDKYSETAMQQAAKTINSAVTAYVTNGPASSVKQADVILLVTPRSKTQYSYSSGTYQMVTVPYYTLDPALSFAADGTTYSFNSYFTTSAFQNLVDYVEKLGKDFENMSK